MLIFLNNITLRVGNMLSFEHTTWQIENDQHWAILGPTGSGKSTLAKGLCHQLPLVQGQILYFFDDAPGADQKGGRSLVRPDGHERPSRCAPTGGGDSGNQETCGIDPGTAAKGRPYLHANEALIYSAETHQAFFRQFVAYHQARWQSFEGEEAPLAGSLLDGEVDLEKKAEGIDLLGIRSLLARKVHQLSNGESRKIFLARLLLRSPRLLILDDPLAGLDARSRARLKAGIERMLEKQDPAVLLITSRYEDIPAGIDRFLLVREHAVIAQCERQTLRNNAAYHGFFSRLGTGRKESVVPEAFTGMVERYAEELTAGERLPEMVAMRGVSIAYQGVTVLKGIDWTVRQGERWALLGANGAGKTTLLSLILADNPQAYTNDIRLFGQQRGSGESIWQIKRRIGWVSPELHVFYERSASVQEVIGSGFFDSVGLYRRCTKEQNAVVVGWMEALDLAPLAERPFYALSTGQQRLILLARALVKQPALLVLDEPCQGLDDPHRFQMIDLVDRLCRAAPVTVIFVSHYKKEIPASITHQISLRNGRILSCGPVEK